MIRVEDVTHSFNSHKALNNLSFHVAPGECFGLLGPNGAGKSTLINILVTLMQPDSGTVTINGKNIDVVGSEHVQVESSRIDLN